MNLNSFLNEEFTTSISVEYKRSSGHKLEYHHWHTHYEVMLILEGNYTVTSCDTNYSSNKTALFIHRPYTPHKVNADISTPYCRYLAYIDKSVISQLQSDIINIPIFHNETFIRVDLSPQEVEELQSILEHMLKNPSDIKGNTLYSAIIFHRANQILSSGRGEAITSKFSYIQDVLQLASNNISEPLTIPQLCERFGIGHTKLLKDFKDTTGTTYKKYMTDLRLTRARELLIQSESIINTSLECGYSSEAHFVKAFREYYGKTPGEFIKSLGR